MPYQHGVRVLEQATSIIAPIKGTAGLQVVFGTAPINLASEPYKATNVPILANSYSEAASQLGFSYDFKNYTLCQSIDATFRVYNVAPIIFINVLDPTKHFKQNDDTTVPVTLMQATVPLTGILLDTVEVTDDAGTPLTLDEDYMLSFNDDGEVLVTILVGGIAAATTEITVKSRSIDPTMVDKNDIVGGYDTSTGTETGLELVRAIYPKFGMTPGILVAPGWSHIPEVASVMAAKCEEINGYFTCECVLDIDTDTVRKYTDVKTWKDNNGYTSKHAWAYWPMCNIGEKVYRASALIAAQMAYLDASNDDVPGLYPSNKAIPLTGIQLEDGTEVVIDQLQGNILNGQGICTFININGWRSWGDRTCIYPASSDVKDAYIGIRRFFSWWGNTFILTYFQKVDELANYRLIQSVIDSENIRGAAYVAQGKMASIRTEFLEEENPITDILNGKIQFHQYLAPFTPAEDIVDMLEFDPTGLQNALTR